MRPSRVPVALFTAALLAVLPPAETGAAEVTDVLDAADGDDPWDLHLELSFDQRWESGQVQREYHCTNERQGRILRPGDPGYDENCPTEPRVLSARELAYDRFTSIMNLDGQIGLWRDLEFHFRVPVVFSDRESVKFAPAPDSEARRISPYCDPASPEFSRCSQSSIYRESAPEPGQARGAPLLDHSLFVVPADGPTRAGLGDVTFGFAWAPFNQERDDTAATWKLQVDYTAPTARRMSPKNNQVGRGLHEVTFASFMSRRFAGVDPYFGFLYTLVEPSENSPFKKYGPGQTLVEPGDRFGFLFGAEFIPWEKPGTDQKFAVDLGSQFVYQMEGRDYSPLYTFLGSSTCNERPDCDLTKLGDSTDAEGNAIPNPRRTDGITDVEQYGRVRGWLGINVQPVRFVQFRGSVDLGYDFDHFLTNADAGKDNGQTRKKEGAAPGDDEYVYRPGRIDPHTDEVNPVFNKALDPYGRRLKLVENWDLSLWLTLALTF